MEDAAPWYPCNFACAGGEKVQFYGTAQIANSVAVYMEVDIALADTPQASAAAFNPALDAVLDYSKPVQAKVAGINYGGGTHQPGQRRPPRCSMEGST